MALKFLFFAQCADWMNCREVEFPLNGSAKLLDLLGGDPRFTPLAGKLDALKVSVNETLTDFQAEVRDGDEVALMPPFSGG